MNKYNEKISEDSLWLSATPSPVAMNLPFYITETGYFLAYREYIVERNEHDTHLLIYTVNGCGKVVTGDVEIELGKNQAVMIDCRKYHKYFSQYEKNWEFFWIHFNGSSAKTFFEILYSGKESAINVNDPEFFRERLSLILSNAKKNDIAAAVTLSTGIHDLFCTLINSVMESERQNRRSEYNEDIAYSVKFIKAHYGENISIDDIINELHISKYHFIRLFSRIMGVTPYSYLTSYRINVSKLLLRSGDKSISEIAEECGFLDASNFINHFKKRTGQKPSQYRRDFR